MKVVQMVRAAGGPLLVEGEAWQPQPGPEEVLVRVYAAGVTAAELQWYPTTHVKSGEARAKAVPGHEFSGIIAGLGIGIEWAELGRAVYGMNDWFADGAMAEYCVAPYEALAPKPSVLSHAEAASVPIGGLTAWQALFDHAKLQRGERVLIHGAAGGVGVFAVQLAKWAGAYVIATASTANVEFVRSLGADEVIDHRQVAFETRAQDLDVIIDTVGGETLEKSWGLLKPGGRLVTVVSSAEGSTDERVKQAFFIVEPNRKQLSEITALFESGRLRTVVDAVVPLSRAGEAFAGCVERSGRGKLVVEVRES